MNSQDSERFKLAMTNIASIYDIKMDKEKVKAWWSVLKRFSIDQIEEGIAAHISDPNEGMFQPKPAHIIKQIEGTSKDQQAQTEQSADLAWSFITNEIKRIGAYGSLDMEDKIAIMAVKAIGGWQALCHSTVDDLNWRRKDFMKSYEVYKNIDTALLPNHLAGITEKTNNRMSGKSGLRAIGEIDQSLKNT